MSAGARQDPYLGSRFVVEVESMFVGSFAEVSGLELQVETETYAEGGVNTHSHELPSRASSPNLVCKRGLTDSTLFWEWTRGTVDGTVVRKNGLVFLLNAAGAPAWGWGFTNAYPVKWTGPTFTADQGEVAVEALELAHDGLKTVPGLPAGASSVREFLG
jgi:phage tail-like protein